MTVDYNIAVESEIKLEYCFLPLEEGTKCYYCKRNLTGEELVSCGDRQELKRFVISRKKDT